MLKEILASVENRTLVLQLSLVALLVHSGLFFQARVRGE
jgi:hypothetical protein